MKQRKLIVALLAASVLAACGTKEETTEQQVEQHQEEVTLDVKEQAESFKQFAEAQMVDFVADTERLASLVKEGKLEEAQKLYPLVAMYYERMQPLASHFEELDKKINGAFIAGSKQDGTGFQRLAFGLFTDKKTGGYEEVATQLVADVKTLQKELPALDVSANNVLASGVLMLDKLANERLVAASSANDEVYTVKAQTEAAEELVKIFMPRALPESATAATEKIAALNELVAYYEVGKEDYVNYSFFTTKQKDELIIAVKEVQQALQAMNDSIE